MYKRQQLTRIRCISDSPTMRRVSQVARDYLPCVAVIVVLKTSMP